MKIILASQSPRRKELLSKFGLKFKVIPSNFNESNIKYDKNPKTYCQILAIKKAEKVAKDHNDSLLIGADTIVILNNKVYPKPNNLKESKIFLNNLSGKTHSVYTGISLIQNSDSLKYSFFEKTDVTFHPITNNEIKYYISNTNTLDKAGAYGIQDFSSIFVKSIKGCYYNVVGLPISRLYLELKQIYPKIIENLLDSKMENL